MCCMNLSGHSVSVSQSIQQLRKEVQKLTEDIGVFLGGGGWLVLTMGDWSVVKGSIENRIIINIGNYYHCIEHPPMRAALAAKGTAAYNSHGIFGAKTKRRNCGGPLLDQGAWGGY